MKTYRSTMFLILFLLVSTSCYFTTADLECGNNEVVDTCPSNCTSDNCPTAPRQTRLWCPLPNPCPAPACKCRFNYRRDSNGTCVSIYQCPAFDCPNPNEVYTPCPPLCPTDSCTQASPSGGCPMLGIIGIRLECAPTCRCKKGYWRNKGICVPYKQCPNAVIEVKRD